MKCPLPLVFALLSVALAGPAAAQYFARDALVQDLPGRIEWMRCSVGQTWITQTGRCEGEAARLSHADLGPALAAAEAAHGPGWRLPTLAELESLVCRDCGPPMIRADLFPDTSAEPYWTSQRNFMAPRNVFSVNFMTGHRYGRFFPAQELAVRLVRDRRQGA